MKSLISVCLVALACCLNSAIAGAQESWFAAPVYCETPAEVEECAPPDAGLLGRSYGDISFLRLDVSSDVPGVDFDAKGFQTSFNIPARWNSRLPDFMGQDVFITTTWLASTVEDSGVLADVDARQFSTGINTYFYLTEDVRPFLQLGVGTEFARIRVNALGGSIDLGDLNSRLVANPGLEVDLMDDLAWRSIILTATEDRFDESLYQSELIYWVSDSIYLRGGAVGDIQNDAFGWIFGAGWAW